MRQVHGLFLALMLVLPAKVLAQSSVVVVRAADGSRVGLLRQVSKFPLYELRYEAPYEVGVLPTPPVPRVSAQLGGTFACTCFSAIAPSGNRVMGRNYDWAQERPVLVLLTKPANGYSSVSVLDITFLGYSSVHSPLKNPGKLFETPSWPCDGMNERGLAVGMMAVDQARSPSDPGRPVVGGLGLIRVLLDKAATVEEALDIMGKYHVVFGEPPIHYFITDSTGASAVVEYFKGELRIFRDERPWQVSTNFNLAQVPEADRPGTCWRYMLATTRLSKADGRLDASGVFGLLKAVSEPRTLYSSSYDLTSRKLELALGRNYSTTYTWALPGDVH